MKTIGFIDYYIDEWHANNYPKMMRESALADRLELTLAWEEFTPEGATGIDQWCAEQGATKADTIERVVEECDVLVVLSPNDSDRHEDLADLPLRSGKPVYIDKTFAPSLAAAKRLFAKAEAHNTPLMSSSALRFGSALETGLRETVAGETVNFANVRGGGVFPIYAIHQLEMLVMSLGVGAQRVMQVGNDGANLMLVDYPDHRRGSIYLSPGHPFQMSLQFAERSLRLDVMDDFFPRFVDAMMLFLDTAESTVPKEETLEIMALVEAGVQALDTPEVWVDLPS